MTARSPTGERNRRGNGRAAAVIGVPGPGGHVAAARGYSDGGKVHGAVVRKLGAMVLDGRYSPGETLPREGDLADALGVSRTSIREAVKVLSAKGLLEARPRTGVRVRDREAWNMLDPAVLSWHPDITGDRGLMRSLIEARRVIEPPAAGMAAARATAADLARIEAAYLGIEAAIPGDPAACLEADVAFHRAVIAASHNVVLASLIGTIEAALRAVFAITNRKMSLGTPALAAHRAVLEPIRLRDAEGAVAAMNRLIDIAAADLGRTGLAPLLRYDEAPAPRRKPKWKAR